MGYSISNIQYKQGVQTNSESSGEDVSGDFKSPKGNQLTSNVVQTLIHQGSVINVTTDNDVVSVIINKHDHTSLHCQPVIQNDLWAHPIALNKIVARAVAGDENNIQYYHKNYLDHVYAVSDKDGDIKEHYRYTAFGEAEIYNTQGQKLAESAIDNDVLWNSRRFDGDTGLYYYKYRHYKSDIGRWLGRDPIEEDGGVNLYAFCYNSPFDWLDKFGHSPSRLKEIVIINAIATGNYILRNGTLIKIVKNAPKKVKPPKTKPKKPTKDKPKKKKCERVDGGKEPWGANSVGGCPRGNCTYKCPDGRAYHITVDKLEGFMIPGRIICPVKMNFILVKALAFEDIDNDGIW